MTRGADLIYEPKIKSDNLENFDASIKLLFTSEQDQTHQHQHHDDDDLFFGIQQPFP
jgi:hypothetical protein